MNGGPKNKRWFQFSYFLASLLGISTPLWAASTTSTLGIIINSSPQPPPSGTTITHGSQLTINDVGPWKLQGVAKGSETLTFLSTSERVSTHPNWGRPSWIPGTPYVYNNNPSNHGGVVPAGGMMIDGYFVPAGTWVAQFYNIDNGLVIEGDASGAGSAWPGIVFRGNRMRGNWHAPGWFNNNSQATNGITWLMYNDAGGTAYVAPNICESIFESQGVGDNDKLYVIRNYLSIATTLVFLRGDGDAAIENFGEGVVNYYGNDTYHLNGIGNGGGEAATLWLRNNLDFGPQFGYPTNPYYYPQNDVIQMAADNGAYFGTGTNLDGSVGYQIKDNYLAGAAHTLQLGLDKANGPTDVRNVIVIGNKFSTKWFTNSGQSAISYKDPVWDTLGNTWTNNTWADDYGTGSWSAIGGNSSRQYPSGNGPRVGQLITAPSP